MGNDDGIKLTQILSNSLGSWVDWSGARKYPDEIFIYKMIDELKVMSKEQPKTFYYQLCIGDAYKGLANHSSVSKMLQFLGTIIWSISIILNR